MKIGLFFGSFNPVHVGHMIIANYMAEFTDLNKVWMVVSPHNPLKEKSSLLKDYHRLDLVHRAIGDYSKIRVTDIEFNLPQPSYTIDTLIYLEEKFPQNEFAVIMGADNLETLPKWKNYKKILERYDVLVYPRLHSDGGALKDHPRVHITDAPLINISSSFIRKAIKEKKDVCFYLPLNVYGYVTEMNFYKKK